MSANMVTKEVFRLQDKPAVRQNYVGPVSRLKEGKGQNVGHDFVVFCLLHFILSLVAKSGVLLQ